MDSHIPLGKECEFQFFDLDLTLESNLTVESKLDLSHILESVLIPVPLILEPSSNHIPLLDQGIDYNDSRMIFQDWSYNRENFNIRILHDPIQSRGGKNVNRKEVIKGEFFETPHYLVG